MLFAAASKLTDDGGGGIVYKNMRMRNPQLFRFGKLVHILEIDVKLVSHMYFSGTVFQLFYSDETRLFGVGLLQNLLLVENGELSKREASNGANF